MEDGEWRLEDERKGTYTYLGRYLDTCRGVKTAIFLFWEIFHKKNGLMISGTKSLLRLLPDEGLSWGVGEGAPIG
jgi:hypothetical protein